MRWRTSSGLRHVTSQQEHLPLPSKLNTKIH
jgi:hypothetical protein